MPLFKAEDLRVFISVYDHGNYLRASQSLRLSQSTVSKRMARLESQINQKLFVRLQHGVRPTQTGERLYEYARRFLALLEEASREFDPIRKSA